MSWNEPPEFSLAHFNERLDSEIEYLRNFHGWETPHDKAEALRLAERRAELLRTPGAEPALYLLKSPHSAVITAPMMRVKNRLRRWQLEDALDALAATIERVPYAKSLTGNLACDLTDILWQTQTETDEHVKASLEAHVMVCRRCHAKYEDV